MARMFNPPHPGEVLREFLPDGMTIEEVSRRLGVSRVQLSRVLNGRSSISGRYGHSDRAADQYDTGIVACRADKTGFVAGVSKAAPGC